MVAKQQLRLNKVKRWILLPILAIGLLCSGVLTYGTLKNYSQDKSTVPHLLGVQFYSPNQFQRSIILAETLADNFPNDQTIKAGIFPHDLTHAEYVAHFLKNLKKQNPKNILLIGPNHFEKGVSNILTTSIDWSTPLGKISTNKEIITELLKSTAIYEDAQTIQQEHSINGLLPYLAYYLPQTKLVPLVLKSEVSLRDIEYLLISLNKILPKDTVILAAVDFSHYLVSAQAKTNDTVTAKALETLDYQKIMSFGTRFNDYVDSPPSIALLLAWLEKNNIHNVKILFNTNSGILANNFTQAVTSYFEVVYY